MVPLLRAVDALAVLKDSNQALQHLMDAVKIGCLMVRETNNALVEKIKKEIQPRFRGICTNQPSATNLFGDNVQENLRKLDSSKMNITTNQSFFREKGGSSHKQSSEQISPQLQATTRPSQDSRLSAVQSQPSIEKPLTTETLLEINVGTIKILSNRPDNFVAGNTTLYRKLGKADKR